MSIDGAGALRSRRRTVAMIIGTVALCCTCCTGAHPVPLLFSLVGSITSCGFVGGVQRALRVLLLLAFLGLLLELKIPAATTTAISLSELNRGPEDPSAEAASQ